MIALSAGHYPGAPGAVFQGHTEHDLALEWTAEIIVHLRKHMPVMLTVPGPLQNKVQWLNALDPAPVLGVEIHFNSDPLRRGRGCETLYAPRSMLGGLAARIVQSYMAPVLPPDRGIKEGWYRMDRPGHIDYPGDIEGDEKVDYFLKATKFPALILEPEFIHNKSTIDRYRGEACLAIAGGLRAAVAAVQQERGY